VQEFRHRIYRRRAICYLVAAADAIAMPLHTDAEVRRMLAIRKAASVGGSPSLTTSSTNSNGTAIRGGCRTKRQQFGHRHMMRRFPPPWRIDETEACFIVKDHAGQALAYVYFEDEGRTAIGSHSRPLVRLDRGLSKDIN
jgi:hypothetical protein